jgi:fatty acid desaturase
VDRAPAHHSAMLGDRLAMEFSKFLTKSELKRFSQVSSWKFLATVIVECLTIAFAIFVSERYWNIPLYILVVVIIGSRMHAFAVLMHDAAHYRGNSRRWLNELIGEFVALPIGITMQGYRNTHFAHHREVNTENDPDWVRKLGAREFSFPKSRAEVILLLCQFAFGFQFFSQLKKIRGMKNINDVSVKLKIVRAVLLIYVFALSIYAGFWKELILYWLVPLTTSFMLFLYIRSVAEHFAVEYDHVLNQTRTVIAPFWERWLFAPHGVNYHLEHHLYPSVPFFRLAELHRYLMTKDEFASSAHITYGYTTGLFRECCAKVQERNVAPYPKDRLASSAGYKHAQL